MIYLISFPLYSMTLSRDVTATHLWDFVEIQGQRMGCDSTLGNGQAFKTLRLKRRF